MIDEAVHVHHFWTILLFQKATKSIFKVAGIFHLLLALYHFQK